MFKQYIFSLCFFIAGSSVVFGKVDKGRSEPVSKHIVNKILSLDVSSSINPATYSYLQSGYIKAQQEAYDLVLLKLNTPGGLVSTTKDIITLLGEARIPTVVWVCPEGASATSAGAIISAASHFLYMSRGSNIGAATPIASQGQNIESDSKSKAVNDLVALVKSLSQLRGRNQDLFAKMIQDAASYQASEAKTKKIVNGVVSSTEELFTELNGQKTLLKGRPIKIELNNPTIVEFDMDFGQKLLNIFADPNMAYILFIIGAALVYFEFQAPGAFIAASLGALCLILAGIGFQVLPLNFGAFGLLLLGFVLMVLELYVTSFGVLSIAGIICFVLGSLFLFRTDDSYIGVSKVLIGSTAATLGAFILGLGAYWLRDHKKNKGQSDFYDPVGRSVKVVALLPSDEEGWLYYQVKLSGELWKARSSKQYQIGDNCVIRHCKSDSLLLEI